jgi:hypothetical protein
MAIQILERHSFTTIGGQTVDINVDFNDENLRLRQVNWDKTSPVGGVTFTIWDDLGAIVVTANEAGQSGNIAIPGNVQVVQIEPGIYDYQPGWTTQFSRTA